MIIKIKRNYIIVIASAILKHKTKKKTCKNEKFSKNNLRVQMESLKNKKLVILGMKSIMCKFKGVERIFFFFCW